MFYGGKTTQRVAIIALLISLIFPILTPAKIAKAETSYVPGLSCYNPAGWRASKIIYNVSQWYGMNPQVVLATLQKEQSLVTNPNLNQYGLDWAMGYGVPDSGNRDYSKQGFAIQVDWATWQLKYNMVNANARTKVSPYYTGSTINIDGTPVTLQTGATASLYRYTPHFHGNLNFRNLMEQWWPGSVPAWSNGNIISDAVFSNASTMTEQQIQDFLVAKGSYLANYTFTRNVAIGADSYRCPAPGITPVYRFYNTRGTHFYTASEAEKNNIIARFSSYRYEGVAYNLLDYTGRNTAPLHRFYNVKNGTHFYTASEAERARVATRYSSTYRYEGIAYYVSPTSVSSAPVYRFYNTRGTHFYTASEAEKNNIIARYSTTYRFEGIGFYIAN